MASQNQPPILYDCYAVQPVDIVHEPPILQKLVVSQDPTPTEKLLISLQNIINQYSLRLNEVTKVDVSDNFDTLQDLCLSVERLQTEAQSSLDKRKADVKTVNRQHAACVTVLHDTIKSFRPASDVSPITRNIADCSKEIQAHLSTLTYAITDLKDHVDQLNSDLDRLRSREQQACLHRNRNIELTDKVVRLGLEAAELKGTKSDLYLQLQTSEHMRDKLEKQFPEIIEQLTNNQKTTVEHYEKELRLALDHRFEFLQTSVVDLNARIATKDLENFQLKNQLDQASTVAEKLRTSEEEYKQQTLEVRNQLSTFEEQSNHKVLQLRNQLSALAEQSTQERTKLRNQVTQDSSDAHELRICNAELHHQLSQYSIAAESFSSFNNELLNQLDQTITVLSELKTERLELRKQQSHDAELSTMLSARLQQASEDTELLRVRNTELDARLQQTSKDGELLKVRNTDLDTRFQQAFEDIELLRARNTQLSINLQQSAHDAMQLSTRDDDLSIQRFQYSNEPNSPPPFPGHTTTPARRTSLAAFSPDNLVSNLVSKKRVIGKRASKGQGSRASIDSDSTQSRSPSEVSLVSEPSLQRPMVVTTHASYPRDATTIGCVRIDAQDVEQGRWAPGVSGDLQELIKDYLKWAEGRKKSHLRPKVDQLKLSDIQCHWHELARHDRQRVCEWERNADGGKDCYHACLCCESRGQLCCILESQNMLVLLPLLPSSRHDKRHDLGPGHRSYWVNDVH